MLNVAINGLGRIGRATLKILLDSPGLNLVAVNDLIPADNLAYLLKFDTVYGRWREGCSWARELLHIDGKDYAVLAEKDPAQLAMAPDGRGRHIRMYRSL